MKLGVTSKREIANSFGNYFINIGPSLANKIDQSSKHTFFDYMKNWFGNSIFLEPILESEMLNVVSNLRNEHSTEYVNVSMNLVKSTISAITTPLTHICNMLLQSGSFSDQMKFAKGISLYDNKQFSNFSVSILPQFSNILRSYSIIA